MTTREEMAGAAFEAWWAAMPQERANELAVCGEQIRSGLKASVKLGYVAARTRDGLLRERLANLCATARTAGHPEAAALAAHVEALLKEFP